MAWDLGNLDLTIRLAGNGHSGIIHVHAIHDHTFTILSGLNVRSVNRSPHFICRIPDSLIGLRITFIAGRTPGGIFSDKIGNICHIVALLKHIVDAFQTGGELIELTVPGIGSIEICTKPGIYARNSVVRF